MYRLPLYRRLVVFAFLLVILLFCAGCQDTPDNDTPEGGATGSAELATPETFAEMEQPLIAAVPEYDVYLYALDKEANGTRVLLQVGDASQELSWDWQNTEFILPRLSVEIVNQAGEFAIHSVLTKVTAEGYKQEEWHYLIPREEGYAELALPFNMIESILIGRLSGYSPETGFYLDVDGLGYWLPSPQGAEDAQLENFVMLGSHYNLPSVMEERPQEFVELIFGMKYQDIETPLPLAVISYSYTDLMLPEDYRTAADPAPLAEVEFQEAAEDEPLRLESACNVRLPEGDLVLPFTQVMADRERTKQVELDPVHGYALAIPAYWQGHYELVTAADAEAGEHCLFYFYDTYSQLDTEGGDSGFPGWVFGIEVYPLAEYEERFAEQLQNGFPTNTQELWRNETHAFLLQRPSDMQYDSENTAAAVHYKVMAAYVEQITADFITLNDVHLELRRGAETLPLSFRPFVLNEAVMVPAREILSAAGIEISWDAATQTLRAEQAERYVEVQVGAWEGIINGVSMALPQPAQSIDGSVWVPLHLLTGGFGLTLDWDTESKTAIVELPAQ